MFPRGISIGSHSPPSGRLIWSLRLLQCNACINVNRLIMSGSFAMLTKLEK
jgi:hypothetical protein